jgi:2-iminobutanoate/2-iminopropanoate deaminase
MTGSTPTAFGPYSPVIRRGNLLWTAGVVGRHPDGSVDADFASQVRRTFVNLEGCLRAGDATLGDVVAVTAYLVDPENTAEFNELYESYFCEPYPVRTVVRAGLAAGLLFEMNAQAVVDD